MSEQAGTARPDGRRAWVWLGLCLVVGLAARLGVVALPHVAGSLTVSGWPISRWVYQPLFPDSLEYLRIASNVRQGDGLGLDRASQIGRMPAYPVFVAGVQVLFGERLVAVRVADAILGTAVIALVFLLARELYGPREGAVAATVAAVYPFFVVQALLTLSETLFTVFLVAGAWLLVRAWREADLKLSALAGLAFGLATLTRGSFLGVAFLVAVAWGATRRLDRRAVLCALAMVGAFAFAMAPWVARNWRVSGGHLVLTTLRVGPSLYEGLNPKADGGPMMDRINWDEGTAGLSEYERDQHWRRMAFEYARENPGRALALAGAKLGRFWNLVPNLEQFRGALACAVVGIPYALVMLLAAVGLARPGRRAEVALILLLPVVYYCVVHMVFVGSVRYREALMPLLVVVAAHGVTTIWGWARSGRTRTDGDRAGVQRGGDGDVSPRAGAGGAGDEAGGGGG
ncbi:MAG TPA: glycosyltransferase family 39 protein [Planctomycetota bacterium]|nr:glycosyltransferase family 39 protein [Planctomycetota bacterium]